MLAPPPDLRHHERMSALTTIGLPVALGIIMFGLGLSLTPADFARVGKGTLAPVDPPRFVVRSGLYRFVRNPMYLAVLTVLVGEVLLLGSLRLIVWEATVALAFHLFVVTYEEPTLRRLFGADFETYCRQVPRWLPMRRAGRRPDQIAP